MRAQVGPAVPVGMAYPTGGTADDSGRCWDQRSKLFRWPGAPTGCENAGWRQEVPSSSSSVSLPSFFPAPGRAPKKLYGEQQGPEPPETGPRGIRVHPRRHRGRASGGAKRKRQRRELPFRGTPQRERSAAEAAAFVTTVLTPGLLLQLKPRLAPRRCAVLPQGPNAAHRRLV